MSDIFLPSPFCFMFYSKEKFFFWFLLGAAAPATSNNYVPTTNVALSRRQAEPYRRRLLACGKILRLHDMGRRHGGYVGLWIHRWKARAFRHGRFDGGHRVYLWILCVDPKYAWKTHGIPRKCAWIENVCPQGGIIIIIIKIMKEKIT